MFNRYMGRQLQAQTLPCKCVLNDAKDYAFLNCSTTSALSCCCCLLAAAAAAAAAGTSHQFFKRTAATSGEVAK